MSSKIELMASEQSINISARVARNLADTEMSQRNIGCTYV